MANAIPLLEGTNTSGGFLVPDSFVQNAFARGIDRRSAVAALANTRRVSGKRENYTEYVGRPVAAFVAEGADKAATGAEYAQVTVDIKKIATVVMYTEELIEDAQDDPTLLINQDVRAAFADLIDAHALGQTSAGTLTSQFNSTLRTTTQTVELGATADAIPLALSSAINTIQANGYTPNGAIWAPDAAMTMRNARDTTGQPLLTPFTVGRDGQPTRPPIYGVRQVISTNLQTVAGTAGRRSRGRHRR
jgi:HK97 family phage major capsid protein